MMIPNGSSDCGCTPACWSYSSNPVLSASQGVTPTPVCISKRKQSWCSCLRSRRLRFVEPISEKRWHSRTIHQPLQCYDPNPHCRHVAFSTSAIPSKGAFLLPELAKESSAKPTVSREYVPRPFNASELPIQSRKLSTVVVFESIAGDSFPRDDLFAQRPNSSRLSEESRKNPVTMRQVLTNECHWCSDAGLCQIKELRCDRTQRGRRRRRSVGVFSKANIT